MPGASRTALYPPMVQGFVRGKIHLTMDYADAALKRVSDRLLLLLVILIYLIWGTHALAHSFYLYWRLPWFDLPMHVMGGLWIGLAALWVVRRVGLRSMRAHALVIALSVGALALGWELLEWLRRGTIEVSFGDPYLIDTLQDLLMSGAGGALAIAVAELLPREDAQREQHIEPAPA